MDLDPIKERRERFKREHIYPEFAKLVKKHEISKTTVKKQKESDGCPFRTWKESIDSPQYHKTNSRLWRISIARQKILGDAPFIKRKKKKMRQNDKSKNDKIVKNTTRTCFVCAETGHRRNTCPVRKTAKCEHCNDFGHLKVACKFKDLSHGEAQNAKNRSRQKVKSRSKEKGIAKMKKIAEKRQKSNSKTKLKRQVEEGCDVSTDKKKKQKIEE